MLRVFVLLLLLANGGYCAWTQGWLQPMGWVPAVEGEPERMGQQVHPELLRVLPTESPKAASKQGAKDHATPGNGSARAPGATHSDGAAPSPTAPATPSVPETPLVTSAAIAPPPPGECLQAGIFDTAQADALRRALVALPEDSWKLEPATLPGRWMVYMGRLADDDALTKKRIELRELGISYDRPGAALEPGLSLGRFSTEEAAQRGLTTLAAKGVRSARVVQERRDLPGFMLRLPAADARLRARVEGLGGAMAGKALRDCN